MELRIRDITLHYEIIGTGKPVMTLHGYHTDHRLMAGCLEPVFRNRNYKRIYLDLPGMGRSGSASWITNADVMLDVITEFVDRILPEQSFLLAGESYGGYLSRGLLRRIPDRVDGLLLICPVILPGQKERTLPKHVVLVRDEELLASLDPKEAQECEEDMVVQNRRNYARYRDEVLSGIRIADDRFLDVYMEKGYGFSSDVDEGMVFGKPALILTGRQDSCVGFQDALRLLEHYPRASLAVLDMAGHNLQIEQEDLFRRLAEEWLDRIETFSGMDHLETERLLLRRFRSEDWEDLHDYLSREEVVRFEPYGVFDEETSRQEAVNRSKSKAFLAVCLKETGKVIGNIYFEQTEPHYINTWELGYVFHPSYQGKGYATESSERILDFAFRQLGAHRILAMCNPENTASWRLLERIGMKREGHFRKKVYFKTDDAGNPLWHDTYEYAILADEWKGRNKATGIPFQEERKLSVEGLSHERKIR